MSAVPPPATAPLAFLGLLLSVHFLARHHFRTPRRCTLLWDAAYFMEGIQVAGHFLSLNRSPGELLIR